MADIDARYGTLEPGERLVNWTFLIYALHAFSAVTGLIGSAFIVTAFLTGWPSIIAVILNYVKRGDVRGTLLESHFRWQIRTFWFSLLWLCVAGVMFVTILLIPVAWVVVVLTGAWVCYRIVRGWWRLNGRRPMPG